MSQPVHNAATANAAVSAADDGGAAQAAPPIGDFLADRRVVVDLEVSSRKRLFEQLAKLLAAPHGDPDLDTVLRTLTRREKLGSTGIGNGIALPHGRIDGIDEPLIAVARLKTGIDYDAPDGLPVWLAVCLLAPVEANETHLHLLAALAGLFNTPGLPQRLRRCRTAAELAAHFQNRAGQNRETA